MSWKDHRPSYFFKLAGEHPRRIEHVLVPITPDETGESGLSFYAEPKFLGLDAENSDKEIFDLILKDMRGGRYSTTDEGIIRNPKTLLKDLSRTYTGESQAAQQKQAETDRLNELACFITKSDDTEAMRSQISSMDPDDYGAFLLELQRQAYHPKDGGEPVYENDRVWTQNPLSVLFCKPQLLVHETDYEGVEFGAINFILYPKFMSAERSYQEPRQETAQPSSGDQAFVSVAVAPVWG